MTERKTRSILQRMPVILAVTAASYGLQVPPVTARLAGTNGSAGVAPSQTQSPAPMPPAASRRRG